jgi:hypothetical protein
MKTFMDAETEGYEKGIWNSGRCSSIWQCDVDHPTQSMADMDHIIHHFGGC